MVNLNNNQALELSSFNSVLTLSKMASFLLRAKSIAIRKGILIPDDFIAELDEYCERNSLIENALNPYALHHCCPACVRAHAVKSAQETGMNRESINFVLSFLEGPTGHNGYYLDEEELVKI